MKRKSLILLCVLLILSGCGDNTNNDDKVEILPVQTSTTTSTTKKEEDNSKTTSTKTTKTTETTTTTKSTTTKKKNNKTTTTKSTAKETTTTKKNNTITEATTTTKATTTTAKNTTTKATSTTKAAVTVVEQKIETVVVGTENFKYGVKIVNKADIIYDYYSDGSKKEVSRVPHSNYDYSSYNATGNDLKPEANTKVSENAGIYNEVLNIVNGYRKDAGASPLTLNNELTLEATIRAMEMAYTNKMSHTRPNGTSCFTLSSEVGLKSFYGENVAAGYPSAASVCNGWFNSEGHKANMLNTSYTQMGIGYYKIGSTAYWAQIFA